MGGLGGVRIFVDSDVWYSRTLRDWIGLLATNDAPPSTIRVFWTEDVLAATMYHLRANNPTWDGAKVSAIRDHFVEAFRDGRVADYTVDGSYQGTDPSDAHVHGAAIACGAEYLVTKNVRHFRAAHSDAFPYEVLHPDDSLELVDDATPNAVRACVTRQISYWGSRAHCDLAGALARNDCPTFAARVEQHLRAIGLSG